MMDLHTTIYLQIAQHLTNGRMSDLVDGLTVFDFGINQTDPVFEEWWEITTREIAVFVNRGGQHSAAMGTIPRRIVRPTPEE
jgi:hypothetical protein